MNIKKVGVIGAGQMGTGIAQVCAVAGLDVVIQDLNVDQLGKALESIDRNLERQVAKTKLSVEEHAVTMARIHTTHELSDFGDCDLVIEAATEQEETKRVIFKALTPHL